MTRRPDPADFAGRDLAFQPADPSAAATLTAAMVDRYNRDGFLSAIDVYPAEEIAAIRDLVDGLLERALADGDDSYSINGFHTRCAALWDLATDPRIRGLVTDILGPDVVCWGTHLFAKMPDDGKDVPFHQDAVYWPFTRSSTTTVWLAIDDVDVSNSAVQFVPGSHLRGPIVHEELRLDGTRVLGRRAAHTDDRVPRFHNELRSGQVSLHSDLLLHGSTTNRSHRRRAGLTLRYAATSVRAMPGYDEWTSSSIVVAGTDPSRSWADVPRPTGDT